jgi:hypothetical protein
VLASRGPGAGSGGRQRSEPDRLEPRDCEQQTRCPGSGSSRPTRHRLRADEPFRPSTSPGGASRRRPSCCDRSSPWLTGAGSSEPAIGAAGGALRSRCWPRRGRACSLRDLPGVRRGATAPRGSPHRIGGPRQHHNRAGVGAGPCRRANPPRPAGCLPATGHGRRSSCRSGRRRTSRQPPPGAVVVAPPCPGIPRSFQVTDPDIGLIKLLRRRVRGVSEARRCVGTPALVR